MILKIVLTSAVFTLLFMVIINFLLPKELRVKYIFEPFLMLILTVASVIGMQVSLAIFNFNKFYDSIIGFVYFFTFLSTIYFLRIIFSKRFSIKTVKNLGRSRSIENICKASIWRKKRLFLGVYLLTLVYLLYAIKKNFELISEGVMHGTNLKLYNENNLEKLFNYFDSHVAGFFVFFTIIFFFLSKFKIRRILIFIFSLSLLVKFGTTLSRASFISLFFLISPIAIIYARKRLNYLFLAVFPLFLTFGLIIAPTTADKLEDYLLLVRRIFLNSDFSLWFRFYDYLRFEDFRHYNYYYYFYTIFSKFFDLGFYSGLGPYIVSLYNSNNSGNGPIPTFYYEFLILFKGHPFALVLHAILYGAMFFLGRLYSLVLLNNLSSYLHIALFYYFYFILPKVFGDYFLFSIASIFYITILILPYVFLSITFRKNKI